MPRDALARRFGETRGAAARPGARRTAGAAVAAGRGAGAAGAAQLCRADRRPGRSRPRRSSGSPAIWRRGWRGRESGRAGSISPFTGSTAGSSISASAPPGRAAMPRHLAGSVRGEARHGRSRPRGRGHDPRAVRGRAADAGADRRLPSSRTPSPARERTASAGIAPLLDRLGARLGLGRARPHRGARKPHPRTRFGRVPVGSLHSDPPLRSGSSRSGRVRATIPYPHRRGSRCGQGGSGARALRSRRARSGCSRRRSRSRRSGCCPTTRRSVSPGGGAAPRRARRRARARSPRNGGPRPGAPAARRDPRLLPGRGRGRAALLAVPRRIAGRAAAALVRPRRVRLRAAMPDLPPKAFSELVPHDRQRQRRAARQGEDAGDSAARSGAHALLRVRLCRTAGHQQFLVPARRLASRRAGADRGGARPSRRSRSPTATASPASCARIMRRRRSASGSSSACRLDLADGTSLLAYPADRAAYGRLTRLLTLGKRRAPKGECHLDYADVVAHGEGQIVVVAAAATSGALADSPPGSRRISRPRLSRRASPLSRRRCAASRPPRGSRRTAGLPLVATNDVLYHVPERRPLQDVADLHPRALHDRRGRVPPRRQCRAPSETARAKWRGCSAATRTRVARTLEIVERCRFNLDELRYEYPEEPVPDGMTPQQRLADSPGRAPRALRSQPLSALGEREGGIVQGWEGWGVQPSRTRPRPRAPDPSPRLGRGRTQ